MTHADNYHLRRNTHDVIKGRVVDAVCIALEPLPPEKQMVFAQQADITVETLHVDEHSGTIKTITLTVEFGEKRNEVRRALDSLERAFKSDPELRESWANNIASTLMDALRDGETAAEPAVRNRESCSMPNALANVADWVDANVPDGRISLCRVEPTCQPCERVCADCTRFERRARAAQKARDEERKRDV